MLSDEERKEFRKLLRRIGRNLRRARKEKQKSQREMSELIGISTRAYQGIEIGEQPISMRSLFRISRRSNISLQELIDI